MFCEPLLEEGWATVDARKMSPPTAMSITGDSHHKIPFVFWQIAHEWSTAVTLLKSKMYLSFLTLRQLSYTTPVPVTIPSRYTPRAMQVSFQAVAHCASHQDASPGAGAPSHTHY